MLTVMLPILYFIRIEQFLMIFCDIYFNAFSYFITLTANKINTRTSTVIHLNTEENIFLNN
jgi:hypothetical protein